MRVSQMSVSPDGITCGNRQAAARNVGGKSLPWSTALLRFVARKQTVRFRPILLKKSAVCRVAASPRHDVEESSTSLWLRLAQAAGSARSEKKLLHSRLLLRGKSGDQTFSTQSASFRPFKPGQWPPRAGGGMGRSRPRPSCRRNRRSRPADDRHNRLSGRWVGAALSFCGHAGRPSTCDSRSHRMPTGCARRSAQEVSHSP